MHTYRERKGQFEVGFYTYERDSDGGGQTWHELYATHDVAKAAALVNYLNGGSGGRWQEWPR